MKGEFEAAIPRWARKKKDWKNVHHGSFSWRLACIIKPNSNRLHQLVIVGSHVAFGKWNFPKSQRAKLLSYVMLVCQIRVILLLRAVAEKFFLLKAICDLIENFWINSVDRAGLKSNTGSRKFKIVKAIIALVNQTSRPPPGINLSNPEVRHH